MILWPLLIAVFMAASGGFYLGTWLQRRQDAESMSDAVERAVGEVRELGLSGSDHELVSLLHERIVHQARNPS